MAILSDTARAEVTAEWQRTNRDIIGAITKADLRAAINAIDQYLSDNAAAINSAIPQPARAQLTTKQKALVLTAVVTKRYILEA
jgi:hypothetical protein